MLRDNFLARWTGGRAGRAALVLVGVHLAAVVLAWGMWAFGLLPVFEYARWVPITLVSLVAAGTVLPLFLLFGFWGTVSNFGDGGGEEYMQTFSRGAGLSLGLLRWFMQIVLVGGVAAALVLTIVDGRWWHLFGTDEIRALPERVATVPVPADWTLTDTEVGDAGSNHHPNMRHSMTYDVPADYTYGDLKQWLTGPEWANNPDGPSFGALQLEYCSPDRSTCDARLVPPEGQVPEYFVHASFDDPSYDGDAPEVDVQVTYAQYVEPRWGIDQAVVDRARQLPFPADWVPWDESASRSDSGDTFAQRRGVPESFTPADLEDWLAGSSWTTPTDGEPFGAITPGDECRTFDSGTFRCDATVDASVVTDEYGYERAHDFVEASLDEDEHTLTVRFRRAP